MRAQQAEVSPVPPGRIMNSRIPSRLYRARPKKRSIMIHWWMASRGELANDPPRPFRPQVYSRVSRGLPRLALVLFRKHLGRRCNKIYPGSSTRSQSPNANQMDASPYSNQLGLNIRRPYIEQTNSHYTAECDPQRPKWCLDKSSHYKGSRF